MAHFLGGFSSALKDVDFNHPSVWSCPAVDEILSAWSKVFLSARVLSAHRFMQHGVKLTCRDKLTETALSVSMSFTPGLVSWFTLVVQFGVGRTLWT